MKLTNRITAFVMAFGYFCFSWYTPEVYADGMVYISLGPSFWITVMIVIIIAYDAIDAYRDRTNHPHA